MDCPIDDVLVALTADAPAIELRHGIGVRPPPPGPDKEWFGTPAGETLQTDNFGVVWANGTADAGQAQAVADELETAWQALIVDGDWPQPTLSESYLVWVVLDPYLGVDGRTVEVDAPEAPGGYPVISIDPALSGDELALSTAHQLTHAVQFRMREPAPDVDVEAWYWEASAVWSSVQIVGGTAWIPLADTYLEAPDQRYDSAIGDHHYGMFLLNSWLEEDDPGIVREIWEQSRWLSDESWPQILEEATEIPQDQLFAEFSAAVGNDQLALSAQIGEVTLEDDLLSGVAGLLPRYGVHHYRSTSNEAVIVEVPMGSDEAEVILASPSGTGLEVVLQPGEVLAVVGIRELGGSYQVFVRPADPGTGTGPGPATGRTDPSEESLVQGSCACSADRGPAGWAWILLFFGWFRRR